MKKLTYFIDKGNGQYDPFYEYDVRDVGVDELYARQLCTYLILRGQQYELVSNEMDGNEEILVIEDRGRNVSVLDEKSYRGQGIHIEFRNHLEADNYKLISHIPIASHFEVIRYLLKDIIDVPNVGQMEVSSTEIDEDRGVYVLYVKDLEEE
ncbi:RNA helicase [Niallia taxi]|uniref:RNA helicase n=1 Tax=Niallia taxi TaxID=2499688 RepID=A0A3S2W3Q8_9BACI|nr:RNA helicase [Niallia taxi]RVT61600.1 RNA helicase [Niallia taxi]